MKIWDRQVTNLAGSLGFNATPPQVDLVLRTVDAGSRYASQSKLQQHDAITRQTSYNDTITQYHNNKQYSAFKKRERAWRAKKLIEFFNFDANGLFSSSSTQIDFLSFKIIHLHIYNICIYK